MVLYFGPYSIALTDNPVDSFDRVYHADENSGFRANSQHGIRVFREDQELSNALVCADGGPTGIHEGCALIDNDCLLLCCGDHVFYLSLPGLQLRWKTQADSATCFAVFRHKDTYIVHGELEISKMDRKGTLLWQISGRDIFVDHEGRNALELHADHILATDWSGLRLTLDYDGNIIGSSQGIRS